MAVDPTNWRLAMLAEKQKGSEQPTKQESKK